MISNSFNHSCVRKERGLATVEMAIAVPVLLITLLLTAEFTRALYQYNTLTKLVRDGSRYLSTGALIGIQQPTLSNESILATKNLVVSGLPQGGDPLLNGMTADDVQIEINEAGTGGTSRYYVSVSAVYRYVPIVGSLNGMGFSPTTSTFNFSLTALSSMRSQ